MRHYETLWGKASSPPNKSFRVTHSGTLWDTMRNSGKRPLHLQIWFCVCVRNHLLDTMGHSGTLWDTLGHSGTLWDTMRHSGKRPLHLQIWVFVCVCNPLWDTLGHSGTLLDTMRHSGKRPPHLQIWVCVCVRNSHWDTSLFLSMNWDGSYDAVLRSGFVFGRIIPIHLFSPLLAAS